MDFTFCIDSQSLFWLHGFFKCSPVIFLFLLFQQNFQKVLSAILFFVVPYLIYMIQSAPIWLFNLYIFTKKAVFGPKFTNPPGTKYSEHSSSYFVRTSESSSGLCQSLFHFCYVILISFSILLLLIELLFILSLLIFGTFVIFLYSSI